MNAQRSAIDIDTTVSPPPGDKAEARRSSRRATVWLAWFIWVLAVILSAFSLLLWSVNDPPRLFQQVLFAPAFLAFPTVGALIASRHPENPIGWIFCAVSLTIFGLFAQQYAWYTLLTKPDSLPGGVWMAWLGIWVGIIGFYLTFSLPLLLFPDGRPPSRRWRPVVWLTVAFLAFNAITLGLKPGPMEMQDIVLPVRNPVGVDALAGLYQTLGVVQSVMLVPIFLACALAPIVRFRRAKGDERHQLKWVAYAAFGFFINILIPDSVSAQIGPDLSTLIFSLTIAFFPIAVGIAILKYRLYDIDLIINRTLVYVPLTAIIAGLYSASVALFQKLFVAVTGVQSDAAIVISTLILATSFTPIKNALQSFVDRRFKEAPDPTKKLKAFDKEVQSVEQVIDIPQITARLLDEAIAALGARAGAVYLSQGGEMRPAHASEKWSGESEVSLPLQSDGKRIGSLKLSARVDGLDYSQEDLQLLQQVADRVAHVILLQSDGHRLSELAEVTG